MSARVRLAIGLLVIVSALAYVAYLAASSSWQYYLLSDECVAQAGRLLGKRLRVSGLVAAGSLSTAADRRQAAFLLQGHEHRLPVRCTGLLPDNLTEGVEVVVEGTLQPDGHLQGDRVITRCASKYQPKAAPGSAEMN
jgi:cytochrome c-type biogenesis protein CcmE